jgi:uncharacterized membrane protein (UPF0127 family)
MLASMVLRLLTAFLALVAVCAACSTSTTEPDAPTGASETVEEPAPQATPEEPPPEAQGGVRVEPVPDEEGSPPVPQDPGLLPEAAVALVGPDGERLELDVELAAEPEVRQRGLMLRPSVREGTGMLFLFPADSEGGFWMRNTLVPLDIAYVAEDGTVVEVLTMVPCEEDPCPSYAPDGPYRYALEVAAGVLTDLGADATWRLELPEDLPAAS